MSFQSIRFRYIFFISLTAFLGLVGIFLAAPPLLAQEQTSSEERPFRLPFAQPSGPDTWLMAQPYGNTTGAYRRRFTTYGASGGIHFGLDLAAPCGTEVVAIADGIVFAVDGPFGSPPHNLMIDHPELGYASMYGHLLEAPDLRPGQVVKQGEVVALTGDSAELCYRRPHLHLEIRDLEHITKYNPMPLIQANWDSLALVGDEGRDFARDLTEPRKWQSLYDQPQARTAGPIINDFADPWPLDWEKGLGSIGQTSSGLTEVTTLTALQTLSQAQQITLGECCTQPYWVGPNQVRFLDQPTGRTALGVWGVDLSQGEPALQFISERLGDYSPDGILRLYPDRQTGLAVVERLADGRQWQIDTAGENVRFTPDSQHIYWTVSDDDAPRDTRLETMWLADFTGDNARIVFQASRTSTVAWLADDELLMTRRLPGTSDVELFTLSLEDGGQKVLTTLPRIRGTALSPSKRYLVYYVTFDADPAKNGVWLLNLRARTPVPQKLPFFGAYRWQNNRHLIYVPFEPTASEHTFYQYDRFTKRTQPLFPEGTGLTIANNDWQVSSDGTKIVMLASKDNALDGLWVLEINRK